ncbi:MAG: DUF1294 domain-containing protein [Phascolarctobacterium sp.]|nr:DUF1294 domain-containing protein [Phascolarctobacterium sp.]
MKTIFLYYLIINIVTFFAFVFDKFKAKSHSWRIPEAQLLLLCLLGGAFGGFAAMQLVRHKTKHLKFMLGVPLMLLLHFVLYTLI